MGPQQESVTEINAKTFVDLELLVKVKYQILSSNYFQNFFAMVKDYCLLLLIFSIFSALTSSHDFCIDNF